MPETGAGMMLAGALLCGLAVGWLAAGEVRWARATDAATSESPRLDRQWGWVLVLAVVIGAAVRFTALDVKGISHPEVYTPGIDLPAGISEPPPRHGWVDTAVWHFFAEPHPLGYYLSMLAWTKAFGTSLTSMRLPAAILGWLSVLVIYLVGARAYGPRVGAISAALLALHGFHTFWSQAARMYVPGAFLGLLSTWLLLEMARCRRPRAGVELGYVAVTVAGAHTVEFFWPLLCAQMLWAALNGRADSAGKMLRIGYFQAMAFALSAPTLSHALMLARVDAAPGPSLRFLAQYFSFGFLFQHGAYREDFSPLPLIAALAVLALGLFLFWRGLGVASIEADAPSPATIPSVWPLRLAAIGSCAVMLGIASVSAVRQEQLTALSALPLLVLASPTLIWGLRRAGARLGAANAALDKRTSLMSMVVILATVPMVVLFAVSYAVALLAPRAFVIFVPFVLIVIAAGVASLTHWRRGVAIVALTVAFSASVVVLRATPVAARDYQGLARAIEAKMRPDDLVFAPPQHWAYTPIFYYLDSKQIVAEDYVEALRNSPKSRVWVLLMLRKGPTVEMAMALAGYKVVDKAEAMEAGALLVAPPP